MNLTVLIPIIIAVIAIVPGTLAYLSGKRQEAGKATREDFNALRSAYREDNQELRTDNQELRDLVENSERQRAEEREEWRERLHRVEASEEVCTRRLSWLLGKLNIPLSDLDKGMNGESIKF